MRGENPARSQSPGLPIRGEDPRGPSLSMLFFSSGGDLRARSFAWLILCFALLCMPRTLCYPLGPGLPAVSTTHGPAHADEKISRNRISQVRTNETRLISFVLLQRSGGKERALNSKARFQRDEHSSLTQ
jgi:hypothetical protein